MKSARESAMVFVEAITVQLYALLALYEETGDAAQYERVLDELHELHELEML